MNESWLISKCNFTFAGQKDQEPAEPGSGCCREGDCVLVPDEVSR